MEELNNRTKKINNRTKKCKEIQRPLYFKPLKFIFMYIKKVFLSILLPIAIILGMMTGCDLITGYKDDPVPAERVAVKLKADIKPVSLLKVANDQWEVGDNVGLFMKKAGESLTAAEAIFPDPDGANNRQMGVTPATGALASATPVLYPLEGNVDFVAYYPHTTPLGANFTLPVNLAGQASALHGELLYSDNAKNKPAVRDSEVELNFNYSLVKIKVNVVPVSGSELEKEDFDGLTMGFEGMFTKANLQLADGSFAGHSDKTEISLYRADGKTALSADFEALLLPANVSVGDVTVKFYIAGETLVYEELEITNYESSKLYELFFEIDIPAKAKATLLKASITPRTLVTYPLITVTPRPTPPLPGTLSIEEDGDDLVASYDNGEGESVTFQWYKDGAAIGGEIGATYTPAASGAYYVVASAAGFQAQKSNTINVTIADPEPDPEPDPDPDPDPVPDPVPYYLYMDVNGTFRQSGASGAVVTPVGATVSSTNDDGAAPYTLTLTNFTFTTTTAIALQLQPNTTIVLNGVNKIASTFEGDGDVRFIRCMGGGLTIQGAGSLDATSGVSTNGATYGIRNEGTGNFIIITGNVTINVANGNAVTLNCGINSSAITINGSATVTAVAGTGSSSYGIYAQDITIADNANVTARSISTTGSNGVYIDSSADLVISGGALTAIGNTRGIWRTGAGSIDISGGMVTAIGGTRAISANYNVPNGFSYTVADNTEGTGATTGTSDGTFQIGTAHRYAKIEP